MLLPTCACTLPRPGPVAGATTAHAWGGNRRMIPRIILSNCVITSAGGPQALLYHGRGYCPAGLTRSLFSWRRPPCLTKEVDQSPCQSRLPCVFKVQLPFSVDHPPSCTIQLHPIATTWISTRRASRAQFERCVGSPEGLPRWLLHAGAASSGHLRTLSRQDCASPSPPTTSA